MEVPINLGSTPILVRFDRELREDATFELREDVTYELRD
jgi:hypothetical protein